MPDYVPVHRDDVPGLHQQDRQQRPLQPRAGIKFPAVPFHPESAQHRKTQAVVAGHLRRRSGPMTQL